MVIEFTTIGVLVLTGGISIIAYFLNRTMQKLDKTEQLSIDNQKEIGLVRQENELKHDFAGTQLIKLETALKDLTVEIKTLTQKLSEK